VGSYDSYKSISSCLHLRLLQFRLLVLFKYGISPCTYSMPQVRIVGSLTANLGQERDDVSQYENFGKPTSSHDRIFLSVCDYHDPTKFHVYTGREQGWCQENQHGLYYQGCGCLVWVLPGRNGSLEWPCQSLFSSTGFELVELTAT
jgi:hypothetical protein